MEMIWGQSLSIQRFEEIELGDGSTKHFEDILMIRLNNDLKDFMNI